MDVEQLVAFRRELHRNPEPAFVEIGTAARIEQAIEGLPIRVLTGKAAQDLSAVVNFPSPETLDEWAARATASGAPEERVRYFRENGTALVVDLVGTRPGPRWGLRVDIDALPMRESSDATHFPVANGFAAKNGAMHACGHDAHATIGVGLLHRLADRDFAGSLRILFQPAEEGVRGAQTMIDAGVADEIDHMLALHMAGDMAVGGGWVWARGWDVFLTRVNPRTHKVAQVYGPVSGSGSVAVGPGGVWISAHDVKTVWRLPLPHR